MRFIATALLLSASFAWGQEVVKSCSVTLNNLETGEPVTETVSIVRNGKNLSAGGEAVVMEVNAVRPGIRGIIAGLPDGEYPEDFNFAERQIAAPMMILAAMDHPDMDPAMREQLLPYFTPGIDLDQIRSATTYAIGEATNMGQAVLVVARDGKGKELGSFLGGFFAAPCR